MPGSDLWALFDEAVECGASDVHLSCGRAPLFRIDGRLEDSGRDVVGREWLLASIRRMLSAAEWNDWELNKSISAAHEFGVPAAPRRFRLSCFWSRGQPAAAVRRKRKQKQQKQKQLERQQQLPQMAMYF